VTLTLVTEGKSVQQMVNEALQRVPNDDGQLKQHYRFASFVLFEHLLERSHFFFVFISAGDKYIDEV